MGCGWQDSWRGYVSVKTMSSSGHGHCMRMNTPSLHTSLIYLTFWYCTLHTYVALLGINARMGLGLDTVEVRACEI